MAKSSKALHIVLGGVENGDKDALEKSFRTGKPFPRWVASKHAQIGDDVVIYIPGPGFYATGRVCTAPKPRKDWPNRYGVGIDRVKPIRPPIPLHCIKKRLPALTWANYPRSITTPSHEVAIKIHRIIETRRKKGIENLSLRSLDKHSLEELRFLATKRATTFPRAIKRSTVHRFRSEAIKQYVLRRASGKCEGCGTPAPFIAEGGFPYLEPHHIKRLADGGPDHPSSVIALCPNCHRHAHSGKDKKVFNASLKQKLKKIEKH